LQEAYIIADYERARFSVSTMAWLSKGPELIAILPVNDSANGQHLSTGAIVGIVIGAVAIFILGAFFLWKYFHHKRRQREESDISPLEKPETQQELEGEETKKPFLAGELDGDYTRRIAQLETGDPYPSHELHGRSHMAELDGRYYAELPDDNRQSRQDIQRGEAFTGE